MHLIVVMMPGICAPSIATGFAEVDDVAEPPAAPAKATGELTDGERLFQGVWQLNGYDSDSRLGTLRRGDLYLIEQ